MYVIRCVWRGALSLLALAASAGVAQAHIYAYEDHTGALVITDAPGDERWRMLFVLEEAGARTAPAPISAPGCDYAARRGRTPSTWEGHLPAVAAEFKLDPRLLQAVIWAESRCNHAAVSPKGARGLMQLMPATARQYGVVDSFDPLQNIKGGARYLRDLLDLFAGNVELALAAYNAGPRSVMEARMRIPPFRETRAYVPAVLQRLAVLRGASFP
jgi:soluble lytic murein transglycosylase-like protein